MVVQTVKSASEFRSLIAKDQLTMVDFYATWCGPCRMISPVMEKLSEEYSSVQFIKVDVDELSDVAQEVGVRAMPTFKAYKKGNQVGELVGANPAALKQLIERNK